MKSLRKLLCCSWRKKLPIRGSYRERQTDFFAKEKCREADMIICQSRRSMSIRDGVTTTPFMDSDSCSSFGMEDEMEEEGYNVFVAAEHSDRISISTRARYTYGLEKFEKNAMIIFAETEGREDYVRERIKLLQTSFGDFRYDAEVHLDLSKDEMETKLEAFFSRDFDALGAVAVVVLAKEGEAALLEAQAQRYHESMLLRWLTEDQPSTLRGKPKIYITEANRTGVTADSGVYSLLVNSYYHDVIGVHIPVIIDGESHPLKMLCERLGCEDSFLDDVYTAIHTTETTFPELKERPIQVTNTLQMELRLAKKSDVN